MNIEKDTIKGAQDFIDASDEFYAYLAKVLRENIAKGSKDLELLKELSELVKVNSQSIKSQREEAKSAKKSPLEKAKARANGDQISV